jgi:hypothetical protein
MFKVPVLDTIFRQKQFFCRTHIFLCRTQYFVSIYQRFKGISEKNSIPYFIEIKDLLPVPNSLYGPKNVKIGFGSGRISCYLAFRIRIHNLQIRGSGYVRNIYGSGKLVAKDMQKIHTGT